MHSSKTLPRDPEAREAEIRDIILAHHAELGSRFDCYAVVAKTKRQLSDHGEVEGWLSRQAGKGRMGWVKLLNQLNGTAPVYGLTSRAYDRIDRMSSKSGISAAPKKAEAEFPKGWKGTPEECEALATTIRDTFRAGVTTGIVPLCGALSRPASHGGMGWFGESQTQVVNALKACKERGLLGTDGGRWWVLPQEIAQPIVDPVPVHPSLPASESVVTPLSDKDTKQTENGDSSVSHGEGEDTREANHGQAVAAQESFNSRPSWTRRLEWKKMRKNPDDRRNILSILAKASAGREWQSPTLLMEAVCRAMACELGEGRKDSLRRGFEELCALGFMEHNRGVRGKSAYRLTEKGWQEAGLTPAAEPLPTAPVEESPPDFRDAMIARLKEENVQLREMLAGMTRKSQESPKQVPRQAREDLARALRAAVPDDVRELLAECLKNET